MVAEIAKVYAFDSLEKYSFRDRLTIRLADIVFYGAIRLIGWTIRWETEGAENVSAVEEAGKLPIFCLWHDRIFAGTYFLRNRGIVVITSQSMDGEYIARFLKRLGYGTIRGSSSRGGTRALVEMIRSMRGGLPMAFTVDGPRGPRYEAKKGAAVLAKKTGNPIVPFSVEAASFWTVKSWDRMQIPKPFTKARFIACPPIYVDSAVDDEVIENATVELQRSLEAAVKKGADWRTATQSSDRAAK